MSYTGGICLPHLKAWMSRQRLSVRELAERAQLPEPTIVRARSGKGTHFDTLARLARGLGIPGDQLCMTPPLALQILAVLREQQGAWVAFAEVYNGLRTRGEREPRATVRHCLKQLSKAGLVQAEQYEQRWRYRVREEASI